MNLKRNRTARRTAGLSKKKKIVLLIVLIALIVGVLAFFYVRNNKAGIAISSLNLLDKISGFVIKEEDKQKEIAIPPINF